MRLILFLIPLTFVFAVAQTAIAAQESTPKYGQLEYNDRFLKNQIVKQAEPGKTLFVSPAAKQNGDGTKAAPFQSLEEARDAIRRIKKSKSGLPRGGVLVVLMEGTFQRAASFELTQQDSGTKDSPIVYRGIDSQKVIISGGRQIDVRGAVLCDAKEAERLHPKARGSVQSVAVARSLKNLFTKDQRYGMVSLDGHILTLAQWPNRGYHHIANILDQGPSTRHLKPGEQPPAFSKTNPVGGRFTFREQMSPRVEKEFKRTGEMRIEGYLSNDWYFQKESVARVEDGTVQLLAPTRYGISDHIKSVPRRVRLVNVLAELDEPGEWYFDRQSSKIFFWPINGFDRGRSRMIALTGGPLVEMNDASFVTLRNLIFENSGTLAVNIRNGHHNLLAGSTVRNGLRRGVSVSGGKHNGITGCEFHDLESAFSVSGGNERELERCYNFATNNQIHSCRRRGYGMIGLNGVGIYFAHNLLHDMNGAVAYKTVDSLLEFNEFYNIGYEMGDFNVAYCGAVWHTMNNVVRFNFVHHLIEPGGHPIAGFRNDDGGAGLKVYGNVFFRSGRGSVQFHGPLNDFVNNISLQAQMMWWTNKSPVTPAEVNNAWEGLEEFGREKRRGDKGDNVFLLEQLIGKQGWKKSPWIDEFPGLAKTIDRNPFAQTFCAVKNNYINKIRTPIHIHGGSGTVKDLEKGELGALKDLPEDCTYEAPQSISPKAFIDFEAMDFRFKEDFEPFDGFQPIPFEKIGMLKNEFRANPPDKSVYRKEVRERFKNVRGGNYDAKSVNARYPLRSYEK